MIQKDFWHNQKVVVLGGGSWGTVLAHLAAPNCQEIRLWMRDEAVLREINSKKENPRYLPDFKIDPKVLGVLDLERAFEGEPKVLIWALPAQASRAVARKIAPLLKGDEILLHATKGIELETLFRVSEILAQELPVSRIGVLSGPNLAIEISKRQPTATVIASEFPEVIEAGRQILGSTFFRIYASKDVVGVEWAGALKNILAIAAGITDGIGFGSNSRAMLISRGLAEMIRFSLPLGAEVNTFLGLAGIGDLLATCSSPQSRNYRVGLGIAEKKELDSIVSGLGSTAEGVLTTRAVWEFAVRHKIEMPITQAVYHLLYDRVPLEKVLEQLINRPPRIDSF